MRFLATGRGGTTFGAVRRVSGPGGWSRMNVVDVCAGRGREVEQDEAVVAQAAGVAARQLNLALDGYASPMNERFLAAFGEDMAVSLVYDAGGTAVASCTRPCAPKPPSTGSPSRPSNSH